MASEGDQASSRDLRRDCGLDKERTVSKKDFPGAKRSGRAFASAGRASAVLGKRGPDVFRICIMRGGTKNAAVREKCAAGCETKMPARRSAEDTLRRKRRISRGVLPAGAGSSTISGGTRKGSSGLVGKDIIMRKLVDDEQQEKIPVDFLSKFDKLSQVLSWIAVAAMIIMTVNSGMHWKL